MSDQDQSDLFDDTPAEVAEVPTQESTAAAESTESTKSETEESTADQTGAKEDADGTPPPDDKDDKGDTNSKMIPEHRFKAALKEMSDKLEAVTKENATLKAVPAPDRTTDPEGYELHTRMETSKAVMRETVPDYDKVVAHFVEMAKENPYLTHAVAAHPAPAKHAYDIAKKNLEIKELSELKGSEEWKEFQEFRKNKAAMAAKAEEVSAVEKVSKQVTKTLSTVPNLNRATDVSKSNPKAVSSDVDELFAGAL